MGIFDKLKFWKKEGAGFSEFKGFGSAADAGLGGRREADIFGKDSTAGLGGTSEIGAGKEVHETIKGYDYGEAGGGGRLSPISLGEEKDFERQGYAAPQQYRQHPSAELSNVNYEVLSSKLDALRAMMDSINQRLIMIERELHKRGGW